MPYIPRTTSIQCCFVQVTKADGAVAYTGKITNMIPRRQLDAMSIRRLTDYKEEINGQMTALAMIPRTDERIAAADEMFDTLELTLHTVKAILDEAVEREQARTQRATDQAIMEARKFLADLKARKA